MKGACQHSHFCTHDHAVKKIFVVFVFITIFMFVEIWGHIKTGSLSLLADALHLAVDIAGFIVSICTLRMSKRDANARMTFGYERVEIIGALFSVFFIWAAVIYLMFESIHRYMHPVEIDGKVFVKISTAGLIVNLICVAVMHVDHHEHQGQKENLNMRATYVHIIGDIIQSIGVIIASVIIYFFKELVIVDLLCTVFFAVLVLFTTYYIVRDAIRILAERTPEEINLDEIKHKILEIPEVIKISDLKCWALSVNVSCITLKILVESIHLDEYSRILDSIKQYLEQEKQINFVNIQIERSFGCKELYGFEINGLPVEQEIN